MNQQIIWKPINHPDILPGYLISPQGYIKAEGIDDKDAITSPSYHSTNGYDFMLLNNKDGKVQLFPIDDIIAYAYIPIPESLQSKKVKVSHINGDTRDISLENMEWVEDIEEWRVCTYPGVKPDMYEVSSWGRVRNRNTDQILRNHERNRGWVDYGLMDKESLVKHISIHRLVMFEFSCVSDYSNKQVNHINGIKTLNIPKNLEWCLNIDNAKHAELLGLVGRRPSSITTEDIDMVIGLLLKYKGSLNTVYDHIDHEKYPNITLNVIDDIKRKRKTYYRSNKYDLSKISFERVHPHPPKRFSTLSVLEIDNIRDILIDMKGSVSKTMKHLMNTDNADSKLTFAILYAIKYGKGYMRSNKYDLSQISSFPWKLKE